MPSPEKAAGDAVAGGGAHRPPDVAVRPRRVPLEPKPVQLDDGSRAVLLRDPYGGLAQATVVTPAAYWVLAHFDGRRDLGEVLRDVLAAGLRGVRLEDVERVAEQAREVGLVFGPAYQARHAEALTASR